MFDRQDVTCLMSLIKSCKHASIQANKQFTLYSIRFQSEIFCYIIDYSDFFEKILEHKLSYNNTFASKSVWHFDKRHIHVSYCILKQKKLKHKYLYFSASSEKHVHEKYTH